MLSACELHVPCMTAKFDRDVYSSICYPRAVFFFAKPERWFRTPLRYQKEHSTFEPLAHLGSASCAQWSARHNVVACAAHLSQCVISRPKVLLYYTYSHLVCYPPVSRQVTGAVAPSLGPQQGSASVPMLPEWQDNFTCENAVASLTRVAVLGQLYWVGRWVESSLTFLLRLVQFPHFSGT